MIATAKALHEFFSGFGIPAYAENTVPDDAQEPYITYPLSEPEWDRQATFYARTYYRSKDSNYEALAKADEIVHAIGTGILLNCDGGYVAIWPENPLIQIMPPDEDIRSAYINLSINAYHITAFEP